MKKYYFFFMLASLLVSSCYEEVAQPEQEHAREVILSVEVSDSESKSAVDPNGGFVWTNGDKISVWAENKTKGAFQTFKLNSGAGATSATFRGIVVGEDMELCKCAIYPAGAHKLEGNSLSVNMPDVYNLGSNLSNTNSPMIAMLGYGETISFGHMAGLMTFSFRNVPAGVCSFVLTAVDKDITGYFNVDIEGGEVNAKIGSGKIILDALVGRDDAGVIPGFTFYKEISIVCRPSLVSNGGWL